MFRPLNDQRQNLVSVIIDGRQVAVPSGQSVAAAVLARDEATIIGLGRMAQALLFPLLESGLLPTM